MKGTHGLIIAAGLGICGVLLNYAYLASRARDIERVYFVAVKPDTTIQRGDRLTEENLVRVGIPAHAVGNLDKYAVRYDDLNLIKNQAVLRDIAGGSLLLASDVKPTHPQQLEPGKDERVRWIPIDSRAFVPELFDPGDMVSFLVPVGPTRAPPPGVKPDPGIPNPEIPDGVAEGGSSGNTEPIGPFKIVSLGNRLGTTEEMRKAKIPQIQATLIGIRVSKSVAGEAERADKLWKCLQAANFRQVGVELVEKKAR